MVIFTITLSLMSAGLLATLATLVPALRRLHAAQKTR